MNKKGFTLIEVLAVVVILGLLVAIISPTVKNLLGDSEDVLSKEQIDMVINATKKYMVEHSELLPDEGSVISYNLSELVEDGAIDNDKIVDPKSREKLEGCVVISYNTDFSQYEYIYTEDSSNCMVSTFDYVGHEQSFVARKSGYYKLETWGAQGGNTPNSDKAGGSTIKAGMGGYSTGIVNLTSGETLYIFVGQMGVTVNSSDPANTVYAYPNGGAVRTRLDSNNIFFNGGGASTHISRENKLIENLEPTSNSLLIVAGGGGGVCNWWGKDSDGGSGGGYVGGSTTNNYSNNNSTGGTQSDAGLAGGNPNGYNRSGEYNAGKYGQGGGILTYGSRTDASVSGAGGGGYYGGGASWGGSGAGGSSYIGNVLLTNKSMYCYNCEESSSAATLTISTTGSSDLRDTVNCPNGYSDSPISKCAKAGNGYAKITYLGETIN